MTDQYRKIILGVLKEQLLAAKAAYLELDKKTQETLDMHIGYDRALWFDSKIARIDKLLKDM